jgi:hypothetical protein
MNGMPRQREQCKPDLTLEVVALAKLVCEATVELVDV